MSLDTMTPHQATPDDHQTIIGLIEEASRWLADRDTDQWARPWPSAAERDERIMRALRSGETWLLKDGPRPVATVTFRRAGLSFLWTPEEMKEPAAYVHRLVVTRSYAGMEIGARLLDWATEQAVRDWGAVWTRIDVWRTNRKLHAYYERLGFRLVRSGDDIPDYPSSSLFQRPARLPVDA
jgi:ribosomal protein S18 acetylase RimI-like enzyme